LPELYAILFHITICGLVVGLGLETAGLGLGLGFAGAGLDYKTAGNTVCPFGDR